MTNPRDISLCALLAIFLICLGAPRAGLHWYPAALVGLAPVFALGWQRLGWRQIQLTVGVWMISCGICLAPDFRSVQWLSPLEISVGVVGYLLLPLILVGSTILSLSLTWRCRPGIRPLAIASVWIGWDLIWAGLRFPIPLHWGALLYDWIWGIQIADLVGIWGVTFYGILINATVGLWIQSQVEWQQKRQSLWIAGLLTLMILSYGGVRVAQVEQQMAQGERFTIGAIQPMAWLDRDRSWDYRLSQYQQLYHLSTEAVAQGAQLVIWPEGSLRARLRHTPLEAFILDPLTNLLPEEGGLLLGTTEPDPSTLQFPVDHWRFHNAALLYDTEGNLIGQSGKRWIFPLFESQRHVPYGSDYQPISSANFGSIGVLICLESVLPQPSQQLVQAGAESLIVLADDSGFGQSQWVALHGALSVFRAVEMRRSLVFVNNTGYSLIVDPSGRIQTQGPLFEPGAIHGQVIRQASFSVFSQISQLLS